MMDLVTATSMMDLVTAPANAEGQWAVALQSGVAGRYALKSQVVYSGLASTIFLGVDRSSRLQVGVKVIMKDRINEEELRLAAAEMRIHSSLESHPNIIPLLVAEETPRAMLLVTPYTPFGDLWELLKYGQTYCESEVRNCAAQILAALAHIHDVGDIIHGDIKPHNFLLFRVQGDSGDSRHMVQLCDFGLASYPDRPRGLTHFRGLRGTSGWFAPEMLAQADYGHAVDIFGAGLILFRMLGGYAPFDPPSCMRQPASFDERYWCHTTPECRALLARLLSLDPVDRGTALQCSREEWFEHPLPPPTPEQLQELALSGPPPATNVFFWHVRSLPPKSKCDSYAQFEVLVEDSEDMDEG